MRPVVLAVATALLIVPSMARASDPVCLTPSELSQLAAYSLPSAIKGTSQRCVPQLGANSFLGREGEALASRYATQKARSWPGAKTAFMKLNGTKAAAQNPFSSLPDSSLQQIVDAVMEGMVSQKIAVSDCESIDTVLELLAPLPPENTAELIALVIGLSPKARAAGKPETTASIGNLRICEN